MNKYQALLAVSLAAIYGAGQIAPRPNDWAAIPSPDTLPLGASAFAVSGTAMQVLGASLVHPSAMDDKPIVAPA